MYLPTLCSYIPKSTIQYPVAGYSVGACRDIPIRSFTILLIGDQLNILKAYLIYFMKIVKAGSRIRSLLYSANGKAHNLLRNDCSTPSYSNAIFRISLSGAIYRQHETASCNG